VITDMKKAAYLLSFHLPVKHDEPCPDYPLSVETRYSIDPDMPTLRVNGQVDILQGHWPDLCKIGNKHFGVASPAAPAPAETVSAEDVLNMIKSIRGKTGEPHGVWNSVVDLIAAKLPSLLNSRSVAVTPGIKDAAKGIRAVYDDEDFCGGRMPKKVEIILQAIEAAPTTDPDPVRKVVEEHDVVYLLREAVAHYKAHGHYLRSDIPTATASFARWMKRAEACKSAANALDAAMKGEEG